MAGRLQTSPLTHYALLPLYPLRAAHASAGARLRCGFASVTGGRGLRGRLRVLAMARRGLAFTADEAASPPDLQFEPPLKIVEYPDPILRARNKRINTFDDNLKKLVQEMFDVMYNCLPCYNHLLRSSLESTSPTIFHCLDIEWKLLLSSLPLTMLILVIFLYLFFSFWNNIVSLLHRTDGIGLSAPQVGINVQLMVFNPAGERGEGEEIVLVNPKVYKYSKKTLFFNEGCLSFPGIYADVERPASAKIDAQDITGARFTVNLSGLPARVFQHEFDHLQGTLFFDRMTEDVLDGIRPQLKALEKKYEDGTGLPSPEKIDQHDRRKKEVLGFAKT